MNVTPTGVRGADNVSLFIASSGNIGIGTTSPLSRTHIRYAKPGTTLDDSDVGILVIANLNKPRAV